MYRERLHKQSKFEVTRFREHTLTAEIHINVTNKALTMMWPQLEAAEKAIYTVNRLPECTKCLHEAMGPSLPGIACTTVWCLRGLWDTSTFLAIGGFGNLKSQNFPAKNRKHA